MKQTVNRKLVAHASTTIDATRERVWDALTNPDMIEQYMFGTRVVSDWKEASPIVWKGEWQGKSYEDKGTILEIKPQRRVKYTHFSPLSGVADVPENYHTVTVELEDERDKTHVSLTQDNNDTEQDREESEKNWQMMLASLKQVLEK